MVLETSYLPSLLADFATIALTIFVAELTDKDALLLLALATRLRPRVAFASGAVAFTITTTIIVTVGYLLIQFIPIWAIKIAGGIIMIGYAAWGYFSEKREERSAEGEEEEILKRASIKRTAWSAFAGAVALLVVLDLAGDATEVLTIVYVAHFDNVFLVFAGCVTALVSASALETVLGSRLSRFLSVEKLRYISLAIFLIIGAYIITSTLFPDIIPGVL